MPASIFNQAHKKDPGTYPFLPANTSSSLVCIRSGFFYLYFLQSQEESGLSKIFPCIFKKYLFYVFVKIMNYFYIFLIVFNIL